MRQVSGLRYGENPHQPAAFYSDLSLAEHGKGGIATAQLHHGKEVRPLLALQGPHLQQLCFAFHRHTLSLKTLSPSAGAVVCFCLLMCISLHFFMLALVEHFTWKSSNTCFDAVLGLSLPCQFLIVCTCTPKFCDLDLTFVSRCKHLQGCSCRCCCVCVT